jgi:hypothetical protein
VSYKDQRSSKTNERDFPHIIEIAVPLGGLGGRLNAMFDFHAERGIQAKRGRGRHEEDRDCVRWCFANAASTDALQQHFGGTRIVPPMPDGPIAVRTDIHG